jgi:alpha-1,6-mannosyltransferase
MRVVDVCAFYTPAGGGVRTYVEAKLRAASRLGHEMIVVAPGARDEVIERGPGAFLVTVPSPELPVDRRYRYFDDQRALHRLLDAWRPDHVEASSPWSSATMVGRWQGAATRSLVMHADPLAAYAYRWLGGIASTATIDRWFGWFWSHLRGLGQMFDAVICPNRQFADRLRTGGVANAETNRLGVEADVFSPMLRSPGLRDAVLHSLGLDTNAILLVGVGRLAGEKRWDMVLRAIRRTARRRNVGLLLVGDGPKRRKLEGLVAPMANAAILPSLSDRSELARLMASADALVHGCEAETFCLVAAEAHASGIPLIVPDRGGAASHLATGAGVAYRAGDQWALEGALEMFIELRRELQATAAARAANARTMDEHFAELFDRYATLTPAPVPQIQPELGGLAPAETQLVPELALAPSPLRVR